MTVAAHEALDRIAETIKKHPPPGEWPEVINTLAEIYRKLRDDVEGPIEASYILLCAGIMGVLARGWDEVEKENPIASIAAMLGGDRDLPGLKTAGRVLTALAVTIYQDPNDPEDVAADRAAINKTRERLNELFDDYDDTPLRYL